MFEQFYKNKASHYIKQRQLNWCFLSLFYFLSIISVFVTNVMFIILSESSKTCYFSTVLTLLLLTIVSAQPNLLQTNSSFPLRLSDSQGMFGLGQICQNSEAKI